MRLARDRIAWKTLEEAYTQHWSQAEKEELYCIKALVDNFYVL